MLDIEEIKMKSYTQRISLEGEFNSDNNKGTPEENDLLTYYWPLKNIGL